MARNGTKRGPQGDSNAQQVEDQPNNRGIFNNIFQISSQYWKQFFFVVILTIATCIGYLGYLETRVNTPFDNSKKVVYRTGLDVPDLYWGTYRPGVYMGLKTRQPLSPVTGLMWYFPQKIRGGEGVRHWCNQNDGMERYGWLQHDVTNFGVQEIVDDGNVIETSFVKRQLGANGGEWTARISVKNKVETSAVTNEQVSLIWYFALDPDELPSSSSQVLTNRLKPVISSDGKKVVAIRGYTTHLGKFNLKFIPSAGSKMKDVSFLNTHVSSLELLRETVLDNLRLTGTGAKKSENKKIVLAGDVLEKNATSNFVAVQITSSQLPFTLDVVYETSSGDSERVAQLSGDEYLVALDSYRVKFAASFEEKFELRTRKYSKNEIAFAQAALANMLGGIGYFYGTSLVQSVYTREAVHYWRAPLFTAVPSRSFFPRGFLWDEGFHGLLIAHWSPRLSLDIIAHWFDLMNIEGWIPREQILGSEALARVPAEFVVQKNTNANPPTFFLTLSQLLAQLVELSSSEMMTGGSNVDNYFDATLERLYPRLQAWYQWFNQTQKGDTVGSYRWRGRHVCQKSEAETGECKVELNPKTLTSGLDDYPRASHPNQHERHVDLYAWMWLASDTMSKLSTHLDDTNNAYLYAKHAHFLRDNELLNTLHWSTERSRYADYGYHTDSVKLKTVGERQKRVTLKPPVLRLVDTSLGYVSLFPFLLQLVDDDSDQLGYILEDLRNTDLFWSKYGIRSLTPPSPLYMVRNTRDDPPYWRGQIWMNVNYMVLRALWGYKSRGGVHAERAEQIYGELRANLVANIFAVYQRSGYIWEQYSDKNGEGSGCRPFTGWSALVVLIMGEKY